MPLTEDHIIWAYRLFYDRDPESKYAIEYHQKISSNIKELIYNLVISEEFRKKNNEITINQHLGLLPGMSIEEDISDDQLSEMIEGVRTKWERLGSTEPHWSVLSQENFKTKNFIENEETFYNSGITEVDIFLETLARNGLDKSKLKSCLELGCGVGRITRWLATKFDLVHAVDISRNHIDLARKHLKRIGLKNTIFYKMNGLLEFRKLPNFDAFLSLIVLQHNPPPIIEFILKELFDSLNPGGVGLFQVATYKKGYRFSAIEYLKGEYEDYDIEMHYIPQKRIFELLHKCNCNVIEVIDDPFIGRPINEFSHTFCIQKSPED